MNNISVEDKATLLMGTLKADEQWLAFYCKCFHQLSEGTIAYILWGAIKSAHPDRYFAKSASAELAKVNNV